MTEKAEIYKRQVALEIKTTRFHEEPDFGSTFLMRYLLAAIPTISFFLFYFMAYEPL